MDIAELYKEIVTNAPVERAGWLLIEGANEFPELSDVLLDNLDSTPEEILLQLKKKYPIAGAVQFLPHWKEWIANLQEFFREAKKNGRI